MMVMVNKTSNDIDFPIIQLVKYVSGLTAQVDNIFFRENFTVITFFLKNLPK